MKKKRIITICVVALVILTASAFYLNRAVIFQRGNPIPYLISAVQISEKNPYVAVDETKGIYISKRGECPELFEYFSKQTGMEFVEQAGSEYLFTDGDRNDVISSEVYWGRYTVWTLPAPDVLILNQNVDSLTVEYLGAGQINKWDVTDEQLDEVIEWFNGLDYKRVEFAEGSTPADGEGQVVYSMNFSNGVYFAYYYCGENDQYIRTQNYWYSVKNPSRPPVEMSE